MAKEATMFVSGKLFQPNVTFLVAHLWGRLFALLTNITEDRKSWPGTNTLAYFLPFASYEVNTFYEFAPSSWSERRVSP
jgi:hypothetical protein